jgi:hypothetical protein
MPRLIDLFQQELGRDPLSLEKNAANSCPIVGYVSGLARPAQNQAPLLLKLEG